MSSYEWPPTGAGGGVTSLNLETGAITLVGGTGITITPAGQNITITATGAEIIFGDLTDAGTDGIVITGGTGAVHGTGTSLAQHVADATHNGYLSSSDWTTFNGKQPAGSYLTAISVTTANGISGTSSGGTTPALTLALGDITPSSINGNTITTGTGMLTLSSFTVTATATGSIGGTNTGDVTLTAVGAAPSANGASLSGQALTLQPADATHPGLVTTGTQTFAGAKTLSSAPTLSTMTLGSVLFAGTGGLVSQDNAKLFWDDTNFRLGIGTATPAVTLDIKAANATTRLTSTTGTNSVSLGQFNTGEAGAFIGIENSTGGGLFGGSIAYAMQIGNSSANPLQFWTAGIMAASISGSNQAFTAKGTNTNDSAAAGYIGEYVVNRASNVNAPTSTQYGDVTSISLTAGDWDVSGVVNVTPGSGVAIVYALIGISITSGNSGAGLTFGDNQIDSVGPTATSDCGLSIPNYRIQLTGTTTVYLKMQAQYSSGTPLFSGRISARRAR